MMRFLLDTKTCIYVIKRSPPDLYERFRRLRVGDIGVSAYYLLRTPVWSRQQFEAKGKPTIAPAYLAVSVSSSTITVRRENETE